MRDDLSVGVLYSCKALLEYVLDVDFAALDLQKFFNKFYVADSQVVSNVYQSCKWFSVSPQGLIEISSSGRKIAAEGAIDALRIQLRDYVLENPQHKTC